MTLRNFWMEILDLILMQMNPRPNFNESTLSEKPAIEQLVGMGYAFIPGDKLDPEATRSTLDKAVRRTLQGCVAAIAFLTVLVVSARANSPKPAGLRNTTERHTIQNPTMPSAFAQKKDIPVSRDSANSSAEKSSVYETLLLALSAMEGILFAMLGVIVQVDSARSLRMGSKVFPIIPYVSFALTAFWLQALFLIPFDIGRLKPVCAYAIFTVSVIAIGAIAVRAIRALDPNHVVDRTLDWYFNE